MAYIGNFPASTQTVDFKWQSVQTSAFSAVTGKGYFVNTTSGAITVTLPSSASVGDAIAIVDYAGTFATNNITLTSSLNIEGATDDKLLTTNREGVTVTYVDATQGWVASSGVNSGDQALEPETYLVDFLVIAGGASGGGSGVGGGAGGFRISTQSVPIGNVITVTVGDGGSSVTQALNGYPGSDSSISGGNPTTITSAGGGRGGGYTGDGGSGGSGGGGGRDANTAGGSGNTPSTSPSQGNNGGGGSSGVGAGGGGGGAGAVGANASGGTGGAGGNGLASSITGSSVTYAGGGGGGASQNTGNVGSGGSGGGGAGGGSSSNGTAGTANLGAGGGGSTNTGGSAISGAGGKGVVILSMLDADYSGTTSGSPTVATGVSGKTILTFTGTGSYTA